MSRFVKPSIAAAMLLASLGAAQAGGQGCATCYEKVVHPPQYATRHETVMVRPQQTIAHAMPPEYATLHEKVMVRPSRTYARVIPAETSVVAEKVLVAPARKEWQVTVDAHGRKIGCWVDVPAQYAVRHRHVTVRPEQIIHETVPAEYGVQARQVMVRPPQVHHQVIPAQYATQTRVEQVAPATASWRPVGAQGHGLRRHW
jgi:hypothetical protein